MNKRVHERYPYVTIVEVPRDEISRIDFAVCAQPKETLESYLKRQEVKPDVITNGGFFSMSDGTTCFTLVDEGEIISNYSPSAGLAVVDDCSLAYGDLEEIPNRRDFISAYPPLVVSGSPVSTSIGSEINYLARRTAIGYNDSSFFVVTVDSPGCRFDTLKSIFLELGCDYAINLDGGGSTRMLYEGNLVTTQVYSRPVDSVMCVYLKGAFEEEPEEKVLYRVQMGAFSNRKNAEALLEVVHGFQDSIGAGYANAYIRVVNGLSKVQVGAFSVRENAERVKNDIVSKGYSAFITV